MLDKFDKLALDSEISQIADLAGKSKDLAIIDLSTLVSRALKIIVKWVESIEEKPTMTNEERADWIARKYIENGIKDICASDAPRDTRTDTNGGRELANAYTDVYRMAMAKLDDRL